MPVDIKKCPEGFRFLCAKSGDELLGISNNMIKGSRLDHLNSVAKDMGWEIQTGLI